MYNLERQEQILDLLIKNKSMSVNRLSQLLYVSAPTVRRDLDELEAQGKVVRTHGGAVLRVTADQEIPLMLREDQNNLSKRIIAQRAAQFVRDGSVIFMDASSTVSYLVRELERFHDIIVITNSPKTSLKLAECNIKNYCTGGRMLTQAVAYVGGEAEDFIARRNADLFFFSARGYCEGRITDSSVEEALVRKAMLKNAAHSYFLCDSSKKGKKYMYNICTADDVDGVIDEV